MDTSLKGYCQIREKSREAEVSLLLMNRQSDLAVSEPYPPFLWAVVCKQTSALSFSVATFLWHVVGLAGQDCLHWASRAAYQLMQPSPIYSLWFPQ